MADATPEVKPGETTSEYKLAKVMLYASLALAVLGGVTEVVAELGTVFPGSPAFGKLLIVLGVVSALVTKIAYAMNRLALKRAAIEAVQAKKVISLADARRILDERDKP